MSPTCAEMCVRAVLVSHMARTNLPLTRKSYSYLGRAEIVPEYAYALFRRYHREWQPCPAFVRIAGGTISHSQNVVSLITPRQKLTMSEYTLSEKTMILSPRLS